MIVARPINSNEPDLLLNNELANLHITDLNGKLIQVIEPQEVKWTHDSLESIDFDAIAPQGWDAFLNNPLTNNGNEWIGSSEV